MRIRTVTNFVEISTLTCGDSFMMPDQELVGMVVALAGSPRRPSEVMYVELASGLVRTIDPNTLVRYVGQFEVVRRVGGAP